MGFMRHDAIVVTSFDKKYAQKAAQEARGLGLSVTDIVIGINAEASFLIAPDGSKEFWPESDEGDRARTIWIAWAKQQYDKGVYFDWAHVSFGGDNNKSAHLVDFNGKP